MQIHLGADLFWVFLVIIALGAVVVSLLWRRRERRILRSLSKLIATEKEDHNQRDFAQVKDVEEALKKLFVARKDEMDHLKILEGYRRDYIGNVAHELKTPIFSIQGYLDSVIEDDEIDAETLKLFLEKASKNTRRLVQIVSDLDTITKYESGFLSLEFEDFDVKELADEVIESLEIQAKERKITLYEYSGSGSFLVYADKFRIRQVLTNLVLNSIRYGKESGYTKIRLSDTGEKIIVEVADNGIGISKDDQVRIFERFYRADKSRSRDGGGSGLGLSICKHIMDAHGEHIEVMSTEGAGSVFSFAIKKSETTDV
ncbi:MAG: sensor histidine kinase [Sphingomonadales bacterium]|jgi:two-component system phosphate regulon sensor histidine kinase PhoR